jgi:predicted  nucleic acid-binding Zn-ribbon protein
MWRPPPRYRVLLMVLPVALLTGLLANISLASPQSQPVHSCYNDTNGNMRLVSGPGDCRNYERHVAWPSQADYDALLTYIDLHVASLHTKIDELAERLDTQDAVLQAQIDNLVSTDEDLQRQIADVVDTNVDQQGQIDALDERDGELQGQIDGLVTDLANTGTALQEQIDDLNTRADDIESDLAEEQNNTTQLFGDVIALEAAIQAETTQREADVADVKQEAKEYADALPENTNFVERLWDNIKNRVQALVNIVGDGLAVLVGRFDQFRDRVVNRMVGAVNGLIGAVCDISLGTICFDDVSLD